MTGPLLLWLVIQLGALLLAALRVPLAAAYPHPPELLAAHVMVVAQVCAAALLFPYLTRTWPAAVAVMAVAWPFAAVADVLSGVSADRAVHTAGYVTVWLLTLAILNHALPKRAEPLGVVIASTLALGGILLYYVALEYGADGLADGWKNLSPPLAALDHLTADGTPLRGWPALGAVMIAAALCRAASAGRQVIHRKQTISTFSTAAAHDRKSPARSD